VIALVLGALWSGWLLAGAWVRRPVAVPAARLATLRPPPPASGSSRSRSRSPGWGAVPGRAGVDRRLVAVLVGGGAVALVLPLAAPAAAALAWTAPAMVRRRRAAAAEAEVRSTLPEIVDLLGLAVGAGLTVAAAVEAVGRRGQGPVAGELARVAHEIRLGRRCADALDDLPARLGEPARSLAATLAASERYGVPVAAALERLAAEQRDDRRRQAEAAARAVPVQLLFPLVLCVLPAFGLLTVAPLLAGAFGSLRL
jgi:tight adherence protein C